jgi:TRAP transporter TAXI family solute receptor
MFGFDRGRLLIALAAVVGILAVSWLALAYVIPTPPSRITIATGVKGGAYELLGNRYKAILARAHVAVDVRLTDGTGENLKLLQNKNANVQVAIVGGGSSNAELAPDVLSLGRINYQPFWIFYRSAQVWPDLTSLKGARIAAGPVGSDTRLIGEKLLGIAGIKAQTEVLSPIFGQASVKALADREVDAVFISGSPDSPIAQSLLRDPDVRLMNFPRAEALSRIYPFLVRLVLPAGAIDFANNIPAADVNLIGTTNAVLVRNDLHPQIVYLLAQALMEVHSEAGLFERAGEFPTQTDPEYPIAESARDFYKNGPTLLNRYLPFWVANYMQRMVAMAVAAVAILLPMFSYAPRLYMWFAQQRLRKLYRRLRVVEKALQGELSVRQAEVLQNDLDDIDQAASVVPMRDSDLFFIFRHHLDRTRASLASRLVEARNRTAKIA